MGLQWGGRSGIQKRDEAQSGEGSGRQFARWWALLLNKCPMLWALGTQWGTHKGPVLVELTFQWRGHTPQTSRCEIKRHRVTMSERRERDHVAFSVCCCHMTTDVMAPRNTNVLAHSSVGWIPDTGVWVKTRCGQACCPPGGS